MSAVRSFVMFHAVRRAVTADAAAQWRRSGSTPWRCAHGVDPDCADGSFVRHDEAPAVFPQEGGRGLGRLAGCGTGFECSPPQPARRNGMSVPPAALPGAACGQIQAMPPARDGKPSCHCLNVVGGAPESLKGQKQPPTPSGRVAMTQPAPLAARSFVAPQQVRACPQSTTAIATSRAQTVTRNSSVTASDAGVPAGLAPSLRAWV